VSATSNGSAGLRLVLATANKDKAREIRAVIAQTAGDRIVLLDRPPDVADVEETGDTLEDNALLKAMALVEATGQAAVADDTGLEVAALGGAPGVRSARYSGENATYAENVSKLLRELAQLGADEPADRGARFRTVALAFFPDGRRFVAEGASDGLIALEARGSDGFGYDPVFVPLDGDGRTFAEMSASEKHSMSHRGRAFRALAVGLIAQG
jgi:XTP/dITP diphosphohydrolase